MTTTIVKTISILISSKSAKPDIEFVFENLRREFFERIAPDENETSVSVLGAGYVDWKPAHAAIICNPPPDIPTSRAKVSQVVMVYLKIVPSGKLRGRAEKPIAQEVQGWHWAYVPN